jgi:hypothetical protein
MLAMIVVTGTRRSGTSMWMQILRAAGFPAIGEAFPGPWAETIKSVNPRGFWESRLVHGIYYETNPDPRTHEYVAAKDVPRHVVKVLLPGVVRTELAFLGRVVCTVRDWRAYAWSRRRMHELAREGRGIGEDGDAYETDEPAWLLWWRSHRRVLRDSATRGYPLRFVGYESLLDDPELEVARVLEWLDCDRVADALGAVEVDPERRVSVSDEACPFAHHLDRLYADCFARGGASPFDPELLRFVDDADDEIESAVASV